MPVDLAVLRPRVRTGLDTDLIAALYPDRRLDYFAGARWSGPLDEVVQDLALQAFRTHANLRNVHAERLRVRRRLLAGDRCRGFSGGILRPTGEAGGTSARRWSTCICWRCSGGSGDRRVLGRFEADVRRPAADNRLTAIVEAYNHAADAALAHLVAETTAALSGDLARR